jgi:hypothetical protein
MINTEEFKPTAVVEARPSRSLSAGNHAALLFQYEKLLVTSSGRQTPFCSNCLRTYFLTDVLVLLDERNKFVFQTLSGDKRNEGKLNTEVILFNRSMNAPRLVYATGRFKGSGFPIQTHFAPQMAVRVFDWVSEKQIAELDFADPEKALSNGFTQSAGAISQDGKLLALLVNSSLTLYKLQ